MSNFQMAEARKSLMEFPPLCPTKPTCNAYSNRRRFPGLALTLQPHVTREEQTALVNWTDQLDMAEHYRSSKTRTFFCIKAKLVLATKESAERVGKKDKYGAWDFNWGDIPVKVPCTAYIQKKQKS